MARPKVLSTKPVQTKLPPDTMVWLDQLAADRRITVSECLRHIVEAAQAASAVPAGGVIPGYPPTRDIVPPQVQQGGHPGSAPIERMPKVPSSPATGARPSHDFAPQAGNALRCSVCGQRKAAH